MTFQADDDFTAPIDMNAVVRKAMGLRSWRMEFETDGRPVVWQGDAANQAAAETLARHHLGLTNKSRLVACVEQ